MDLLLQNVFEATLRRSPNACAVLEEDGQSMTYSELDALARRYERTLAGAMLPGDPPYVGVLANVSAACIAALIAILRSGRAYVPLDDASPQDRLAKIMERTGLRLIFADRAFSDLHGSTIRSARTTIWLSEDENEEVSPAVRSDLAAASPTKNVLADDLAYVLHSSGSTGVPKGIMLTHRNARTFVDWMDSEFAPTPQDVVMSRAPLKFDLSVWDIFNSLKAGATVVCFDWHKRRHGALKHRAYVDLMRRVGATILYTTPSVLVALLNHGGLADGSMSLRTVMYAGEPFPPAQLKRVMEALPGVRFANIYGPTETNIVTCHWVTEVCGESPIPLGLEVADTEILVVDPDTLKVCQAGEIGELWCRGGTVTLGYLGMPEETRRAEAQSPIHPYPARFWRTGDYGLRDSQGVLHYRGRRDHMVKINGYRIELGDVEHALAAVPGLDTGVVVVAKGDGEPRLTCHFCPLPGHQLNAAQVNDFLASRLPLYMLPRAYHLHAALPFTSSGKVDRMALAELI